MQPRMKHPAFVIPGALPALLAVNKATECDGVPYVTHKLVHLRASQINACGVCVDMHARELKKAKQSDERVISVAAWRETPYFTDAERAALALCEAMTRLADKSDAVPDDVWNEVAKHYDEPSLAALVLSISLINFWNRVNGAVKFTVGTPFE